MKLALAQTRPARGHWQTNLDHHQRWIALAVQLGADAIIFPELSLTGYEPSLAAQLAMVPTDDRLAPLQQLADRDRITIGLGLPTRHPSGVQISLLLFHPQAARQLYSKQYLHADEEPFFIPGHPTSGVIETATEVAIAICYELSVPEHAARAAQQGAKIYLASVAKSAAGVKQATARLQAIAQQYGMSVVMVNCVGPCEDFDGAGSSAVWDAQGQAIAQLDDTQTGLLLLDTATGQVITQRHAVHNLPAVAVARER